MLEVNFSRDIKQISRINFANKLEVFFFFLIIRMWTKRHLNSYTVR